MGHPIHKHMNSGMSRASSAEKFDAKEAYNKDLDPTARMHYLENDIADKKGMSRYSVEKGPHAPHGDAPHRDSSPVNNVSYGTGYIGKPSAAYMNVDPAEDVMSGDEDTREGAGGMSRKTSPLNGHGYHKQKKK